MYLQQQETLHKLEQLVNSPKGNLTTYVLSKAASREKDERKTATDSFKVSYRPRENTFWRSVQLIYTKQFLEHVSDVQSKTDESSVFKINLIFRCRLELCRNPYKISMH